MNQCSSYIVCVMLVFVHTKYSHNISPQCAKSVLLNKIVSSEKDIVGIVLFGTVSLNQYCIAILFGLSIRIFTRTPVSSRMCIYFRSVCVMISSQWSVCTSEVSTRFFWTTLIIISYYNYFSVIHMIVSVHTCTVVHTCHIKNCIQIR